MTNLRFKFAVMLFSAVAAVASWQVLVRVHPIIPMPQELMGLTQPTTEQVAQLRAHSRLNATYAFAIYGALAMLVGLPVIAIAADRPSVRGGWLLSRGVGFVVLAALAGGVCGILFSWIGFYGDDWLPITWDPLLRVSARIALSLLPFMLVASLLTILFTAGWGKMFEVLLGGLIGVGLVSVVYPLVAGMAFPRENADAVLPPGSNCQLLLFFLVPWSIWTTIIYQLKEVRSSAARPSEHTVKSV